MTNRLKLIAILITLLFASPTIAQTQMVIHMIGGDSIIAIRDIARISFDLNSSVPGDLNKWRHLAEAFRLLGNHPNPFNPSTTISYELGAPGQVELKILDLQGREIAMLVANRQAAGSYQVQWDGRSSSGEKAASGAYFSHLTVNGAVQTRQLLMLK